MGPCGQRKTVVSENDQTLNVVPDRQKRFENTTCGRGFFLKRRKNILYVFKNIRILA